MKTTRIICLMVAVFLLAGAAVFAAPATKVMPNGNGSNTISGGEQKTWPINKEGYILRIYCRPEGQLRLQGTFAVDFASLTPASKHQPGTQFSGQLVRAGTDVIAALNIYCAKDTKGPWRWLQGTADGYFTFALESEREIGYAPEIYMFEIRYYRKETALNCSMVGSSMQPMVTLNLSTLPAPTGKMAEMRVDSAAASFAISARKLTDAVMRTNRFGTAQQRPVVIVKGGKKVGESTLDKFDNPFCVKALVDSAKAFALSAKAVPELSATAATALKQIEQIDQWTLAQIRQRPPEGWRGEKNEALVSNLGVLRAKLAQAIEPFLRPSSVASAEKLSLKTD